MESPSPITEIINRLNHNHPIRAECFEIHALLVNQPSLIVWRQEARHVHQAKRSMVSFDGLAGFAVIEQDTRVCLYDQSGKFMASEIRLPPPHIAAAPVVIDLAAAAETARLVLETPYLLEASHLHVGAAVNVRANYTAIARLLLAGKDHEFHLAGVSWAATGGGDAVFLDLAHLPNAAADIFLEHRLALAAGDIVDWRIYDQEMFIAIQSYRSESFCDWLIQASSSTLERADVSRRLATLPPDERKLLCLKALCELLPHVVYQTDGAQSNDKHTPEILEPDGPIKLPDGLLRLLA